MKSLKTAAILAVVLLALGGLATWDEWKTKKDETDTKTKNRLSTFVAENVNEITYWTLPEEISASGSFDQQEIRLIKSDGQWTLSAPIFGLADGATVDSMVKSILDYNYAAVVSTEPASWKNFGLENPVHKVMLKTTSGAQETYFFGSKAPVGYNSYTATSRSADVFMGSQHISMAISKSLYDLRDKSLISIKEADITAFSYESGAVQVYLIKKDGKYSYALDGGSEADGAYVKDFIEDLNFARVERFLDSPDPDLLGKFASPEVEIVFSFGDLTEKRISFLSSNGKLYAAIAGKTGVMELPAEFSRKVLKKANDFRNRRIVDAAAMAAVTGLTIDGVYFKKISGSWYSGDEIKRAENPVKDAELAKESANIRPFVVDLEFAKTEDFYALNQPDYAQAAEMAPVHRIILELGEAGKKNIEVFKHKLLADKYWVRVEDVPTGFLVPRSNFAGIDSMSESESEVEPLSPEG